MDTVVYIVLVLVSHDQLLCYTMSAANFEAALRGVCAELGAAYDDGDGGDGLSRVECADMQSMGTHFVSGEDKRGVLWTFVRAAQVQDHEAARHAMLADVVFHEAAMHIDNPALGGVVVHGGASAAIVDALAAQTGIFAMQFDFRLATAEQTFKYRRPFFVGRCYRIECKSGEVQPGRSVVVDTTFVDSATGKEVLSATSLLKIPQRRRKSKL
jgi:acyl-coenzyme A thioesterase PaaI-like protein